MNLERIGITIKRAREERKLTQKELGEMIKVSRETVNGWEHGKHAVPIFQMQSVAQSFKPIHR